MVDNFYLNELHFRNLRDEEEQQHRVRVPRIVFPRVDPTEFLTDFEFKRHFRFDKHNVERLARMLDLSHRDNRGSPLTPVQTVCIALNHFAGAHFQRVSGYCGNCSQSAAWWAIDRVRQGCGSVSIITNPDLELN